MIQATHRMSIFKTGLQIIETLMQSSEPLTVKEIACNSKIHLRSVYRYLTVLETAFYPRLRVVGSYPKKWYLE